MMAVYFHVCVSLYVCVCVFIYMYAGAHVCE